MPRKAKTSSGKRAPSKAKPKLIARTVPDVRRAVRGNSPFYGIEGQGWLAREARWIDVHEDDLDEGQMAKWIRQAAALPGWGAN